MNIKNDKFRILIYIRKEYMREYILEYIRIYNEKYEFSNLGILKISFHNERSQRSKK